MSNNANSSKPEILLALIAVTGVLGAALIGNLGEVDKFIKSYFLKRPVLEVVEDIEKEKSVSISSRGVGIVFDPPSNIRSSPNGKIICSVLNRETIDIGDLVGRWYETNVCGDKGFIHNSQIKF